MERGKNVSQKSRQVGIQCLGLNLLLKRKVRVTGKNSLTNEFRVENVMKWTITGTTAKVD